MKIFLDACIIIYWVEAAEPFYSQLLSKLQRIADKYPKHTLSVSRLSLLECLVKPLHLQNMEILKVYKHFFEAQELEIIEIDAEVIDIATQLRVNYNIRTPDAIQIASCLSMKSEHLFVTNDKKLSCHESKLNIMCIY